MAGHCERDDIEVTPEMVEAGALAFSRWFDEHEDEDSSWPPRPWIEVLVASVYREMGRVSPPPRSGKK